MTTTVKRTKPISTHTPDITTPSCAPATNPTGGASAHATAAVHHRAAVGKAGRTDVPRPTYPRESPKHTIQDLALGDIAVEGAASGEEANAMRAGRPTHGHRPRAELEALEFNVQKSLDRLLDSTYPADLEAIADVLHGLYHDMADIVAVMNITYDLNRPASGPDEPFWQRRGGTSTPT